MKKKLLSALLATAMAASLLVGCGGGSSSKGGSSDDYAKEIDMKEDPYTVAIQVVVLPATDYSAQEEAMEDALNEITVPAINCKVDIQFVWISEVANTTSNAILSNGKEKIDLVHVATVSPLSSMVGAELLLDMNDGNLLQNRGSDIVDLYGDLLKTGYVRDEQLAIPAKQYNVTSKGIYYNKTVADELGITLPEKGTMDDLKAALEKVAAAKPDMIPYYAGEGTNDYAYWLLGYNGFGTQASYGAILDEQSGNTKIENLYASDEWKEYALTINEWRNEGLLKKDSTDKTTAQDYYNQQQLFSVVTDITPTLEAQYKSTSLAAGFESEFMTLVDPAITNSATTEYMWGIAATSERPDKAMDLLNFIYSDEGTDAANILMYGLEGENYEKTTDQVITSNGSYIAPFLVVGKQDNIYVQSPSDESSIDEWHTLMSEATTSKTLGYMFDDSDYQTESAAISNVITQYLPTLTNGMCGTAADTEAYIDEFVKALEAAGINDVIAANQEQLDEFLGK